ncbi:MAG: outer membrane beta-barrel protein [Rhizobacter sp.]|nr:outer membrane beta-barrel protein [Ferruginibacter sp.]
MKKFTLLMAAAFICQFGFAQEDSSVVKSEKRDTIRIGNILIIKKGGKSGDGNEKDVEVKMGRRQPKKNSRVVTNWFVLDLGFANYVDKTDYLAGVNNGFQGYLVNRPGTPEFGKGDFKLRTGKSINVNIWFVMQKLALEKKGFVNLKYGVGLELNNYRYKTSLTYKESGLRPYGGALSANPFIYEDSIAFSKNKLAADYLTVPLMLNFTSNPSNNKKGISLSAGVSAGYLYSQRNKQKSDANGKERNKGEYDLERFKLSYVAELGLGPVRLYGSYSPKSMYEHDLDMRPFTLGFRLSNW